MELKNKKYFILQGLIVSLLNLLILFSSSGFLQLKQPLPDGFARINLLHARLFDRIAIPELENKN
jgi:hypothetical protein